MMFVSSSLTRVWFGSRFVSCSLPRTKHARAICHLFSGNYKSVVPYLIDYQSHCSDFDLLLLGTKVFKKLRVLLELFKLAWRSWPLVIRSLSDASYEMESLAKYDSRESLNGKRKLPFFFLILCLFTQNPSSSYLSHPARLQTATLLLQERIETRLESNS